MSKRFIILLGAPTTAEQEQAFREWAKANFTWWHWLLATWLLIDRRGVWEAEEIRDKVNECYPGVRNLVLELRADGTETWAGYGPLEPPQDMFEWITHNWKQ